MERAFRKECNTQGIVLFVYKMIMSTAVTVAMLFGIVGHLLGNMGASIDDLLLYLPDIVMEVSGWGYLWAIAVGLTVLFLWKKPTYIRNEIFKHTGSDFHADDPERNRIIERVMKITKIESLLFLKKVILAAVLPRVRKGGSPKLMQNLALAMLPICLVLQMLPVSAALVFTGPGYYNRELYSCFDLMLWGNAVFGPTLSGLLTVVLILMSVILRIRETDRLRNAIFVCTILAGVFMLISPLLYGLEYLTVVGLIIVLLLISSAGLQASANGRIGRK